MEFLLFPIGFIALIAFFAFISFSRSYYDKRLFINDIFIKLGKKHDLYKRKNNGLFSHIDNCKISITVDTNQDVKRVKIYAPFSTLKVSNFEIMSEDIISNASKKFGINDFIIHDDIFDKEIHIVGEDALFLTGFLSKNIRNCITGIKVHSNDFIITSNYASIIIHDSEEKHKTISKVDHCLNDVKLIMNELHSHKPVKKMLINNILHDTSEKTAYNNFKLYIKHYPFDEETKLILTKAFTSPSTLIKIEAAPFMQQKGIKYLLSILKTPDKYKTTYIVKAIFKLVEMEYKNCSKYLNKLYLKTEYNVIKAAVLEAFNELEDISASDFLVNELQNGEKKFNKAIIETLATCGNAKAIEPLQKLSKRTLSPALKTEIRKTITSIQSRLDTKEIGLVSLAEDDAQSGAVSVQSDDEKGGLSV